MRTIFKYNVAVGITQHYFSKGFKILHFAEQNDGLYIWVQLTEDEYFEVPCEINVVGTGWDLGTDERDITKHIGTCLTRDGLVWHAFQVIK